MEPKIIVHGGAWEWDDAHDGEKNEGVRSATAVGYAVLQKGGSALDAVEQAVRALEDTPCFDAGTGGYLNRDGVVELDALIVDGSKHDFGSVGAVTRVKNPVSLARKIMEQSEHRFFVGAGADKMAAQLGEPIIANVELVTSEMYDYFLSERTDGASDTVGAVAIDQNGNVAVATSTSGTPYKPAGRVGDSPLLGAGGYAENGVGAVGATGLGENSMRTLLSKYCCDQMRAGLSAQAAAEAAMVYVEGIIPNSMSGVIVVDGKGNLGVAHTTPKIAIGWVDVNGVIGSGMVGRAFHAI